MRINTNDIIARREKNGRQVIWLSESFVMSNLDVTENYLWKKARPLYVKTVHGRHREAKILPDTGASWRWARMNNTYYYDLDRLPAARRAMLPSVEDMLAAQGNAIASVRQRDLEGFLHTALEQGYRAYLHMYRGFSDTHATALARAAAVCMSALEYGREIEWPMHRSGLYVDVACVAERLQVRYVPYNWRRLKEKLDALREGKEPAAVITLPRAGNGNAVKHDDDEVYSWLIQLRRHPANYTDSYIARKLAMLCALSEKPAPSSSWVAGKLAEATTKFLTVGRYGSGRLANRWESYTPVSGAVHAADCWQIDGTRVNFVPFRDENGAEKFLYVIAIIDVHSGDILGTHFDTKEDRWGYVNVLKMACAATGHLPGELVIDRFPGHNTQEWQLMVARMEREGVRVRTTSKKTGKAKIERVFGTIQSVFLQESKYYYGEGIQSRRASAHRAPEYIKQVRRESSKDGWSFENAWREASRCIELYRNTKYSTYSRAHATIEHSPRELYANSETPYARNIEPWVFAELFGLEKTVSIRRGLIRTEIQRLEYFYAIDDVDMLMQRTTVRMCYDLGDLGTVHLFEDSDDVNRAYLGEVHEQRRVAAYGPATDAAATAAAEARKARINARRDERLAEIEAAGSELASMMAGLASKDEQAQAENAWLAERIGDWKPSSQPRLLATPSDAPSDDDEEELVIDIRRQY